MARIVNIGFNLKTSEAVRELDKFQKGLSETKKVLDSIKNTTIQPKVDSSSLIRDINKLKASTKNGLIDDKALSSTVSKFAELQDRINRVSTASKKLDMTQSSFREMSTQIEKASNKLEYFSNIMSNKSIMGKMSPEELARVTNGLKGTVREISALETALKGMSNDSLNSIAQFEKMNKSLEFFKSSLKSVSAEAKSKGLSSLNSDLEKVSKGFNELSAKMSKGFDFSNPTGMASLKAELENYIKLMNKAQSQVSKTSLTSAPRVGQIYSVPTSANANSVNKLRDSLIETRIQSENVRNILNSLKVNTSSIDTFDDKMKAMLQSLNSANVNIGAEDLERLRQAVATIRRESSQNMTFAMNTDSASKEIAELIAKIEEAKRGLQGTSRIRGFEALESNVRGLQQRLTQVSNQSQLNNVTSQLRGMNTAFTSMTSTNVNPFVNGLKSLAGQFISIYTAINLARTGFKEFMEFEDAVYNLAVVADVSEGGIRKLKSEMIAMSAIRPFSVVEITDAVNETVRMGRSYSEAVQMVESASRLATASGEDLADSMLIVNKIFTALKLKAGQSEEAMQMLHSTAVATATDLEGLGESAKQWIGAVGVLAETTKKVNDSTGNHLDEYRLQLMGMGTAFSGILSNMGRVNEAPYVEKSA